MKKNILSVLLAVLMLFCVSLTAFASSPAIQYTSSYNADTGLVSVTLFLTDAVGLEAADLNLAYNTSEYSFVDYTQDYSGSAMIAAGKAITEDGLCTCSPIFTESCKEEDLDENGNLPLVTYHFKPLTDQYDIDNFCAWATSYQSSGTNMLGSIKSYGNENLKVGHDKEVTVKKDTSSSASSGSGSKWYIYVIAAVLAVCAVVGIAVIAVKNGQQDASGNSEVGKSRNKKSDKAGSGPEETDPSDKDEPEE